MVETVVIQELRENLPKDSANLGIDERTRAVLNLLLDLIPSVFPSAITPNPQTCPNCDVVVTSSRSPYCGNFCRETSAFVRQFRDGLEKGTVFDAERQAALGQKLWYVLGGGYPRRETLVPDRVIKKVIEREGNKCQECGALATTIDHSGSG